MNIAVITLFPEMFDALNHGVSKRAIQQGLCKVHVLSLRMFGRVDDKPYGGGAGMILQPEPVVKAIEQARQWLPEARVVYVSPQGVVITQHTLQQTVHHSWIILCGRYDGIDERIFNWIDEEWSIGDYILSGGELAAMVLLDGWIRLLPGTLGNAQSLQAESSMQHHVSHPQYTRPALFRNLAVPDVLLSGHHDNITHWRKHMSHVYTKQKKPHWQ
jgi:tRNA (guanine37-N1)-methyltransferase